MELSEIKSIPEFDSVIEDRNLLNTKKNISVMQINVGRLCNLACKHCHVSAGPARKEIMDRKTFEECIELLKKNHFSVVDITGGAPEMNGNMEWFIKEASKLADKVIVRTNLVILLDEKYRKFIDIYAENKVNVVCSLPFYTESNTDKQRGKGIFEKSVEAIKLLNEKGYGENPDLVLDVVYNPNGAFLPSCQKSLQDLYKERLYKEYGIKFNNLYAITNNPIGRFKDFLERKNILEDYMSLLYSSFNPATVENMMCRDQISISWDGYIYDCDFNQAEDIKAEGNLTVKDLVENGIETRRIKTGKHCYACTAGLGSSCGGETA